MDQWYVCDYQSLSPSLSIRNCTFDNFSVGKNDARNAHAAPSLEVYRTLANDLYAESSASTVHDNSICGPAESPNNHHYEYVLTRKLEESEASPYEVPITLATSK